MTSLDDFETKLNMVSYLLVKKHFHFDIVSSLSLPPSLPLPPSLSLPLPQALERNAILENELDEKDELSVACQRLKDEVRG